MQERSKRAEPFRHEVMACMRSSATAFLFSVPFFLQLLLGVALARACMREAGCRGVNGALRNLQARARAGRHLLRPCTFPRPHGIALRPGLLLPCPLLSHLSHLSPFLFSPSMAAAAPRCISMAVVPLSRTSAGATTGRFREMHAWICFLCVSERT